MLGVNPVRRVVAMDDRKHMTYTTRNINHLTVAPPYNLRYIL